MICVRRLLPVVACVALGACGAQERAGEVRELPAPSTPTTTPVAPATESTATVPTPPSSGASDPAAPAPSPDPAVPPAGPEPDPGRASAEGEGTGGAGDEEPIRQPARFTLGAGDVRPASVSVAAFLTVALEIVNDDAVAHRIALVGTDVAFSVAAGQSARRELAGVAAGMYTLSVDGGKAASALVVGDDAAP